MRARLLAALCAVACSSLGRVPPADHVVAAPISQRANVVLGNLVTEFGSADGRWKGSMSPGCCEIWATQFGYRAGVRRDRDDILAIGRATARRASSRIRREAIFGDADLEDPAYMGFPALLISGTLGGRGFDAWMFEKGLGRLDEIREQRDLRPRDNAGLAVLIAEVARLQPKKRAERLAQARTFAADVRNDTRGVYAFLAWTAIARASGEAGDLEHAREAEKATRYRFDADAGVLQALPDEDEVLSSHLAMVHGYADLAQASGDALFRNRAVSVLDYVFSDAWFDGRFLIHDRMFGAPSADVCPGCNWMALYLVDRLYGDSFVIDPVPVLPKRDWPEEQPLRGYDHKLVLGEGTADAPGEAEFALAPIRPRGRLLFAHATRDVRITFEYEMLSQEQLAPDGGVEVRWQAQGRDAKFGNKYSSELPFDATGAASLGTSFYAFEPLLFRVAFARDAEGELSVTIRLREREP